MRKLAIALALLCASSARAERHTYQVTTCTDGNTFTDTVGVSYTCDGHNGVTSVTRKTSNAVTGTSRDNGRTCAWPDGQTRKAWFYVGGKCYPRKAPKAIPQVTASEPCAWHPRNGANLRFLTCAGVSGPVSETIGESGGVRDFKPWILVTGAFGDSLTLYVVPAGTDNSPQGEDNPNAFEVTDVPTEWLPSNAGLHDAFALTPAGFRLLATFKK